MELILVLLGNVEVDVEVSRVLESNRVVENDCEQDDKNEKPEGVYSVLISCHKVLTKIHRLQVKQSQSVHHRDIYLPEVWQSVAPNLPNDHRHQPKHQHVTQNQVKQVGRSDPDDLEKQRHSPRYGGELDEHEHVHEDQNGIKQLGEPIQSVQ